MIKLKRLLLESREERYILDPHGNLFVVDDHVSWAAENVLKNKYGNYDYGELADRIDDVYNDLNKLGYLMLIWMGGTDELYIRGNNSIPKLKSFQLREIEKLAYIIGDEGLAHTIKLVDDGEHELTLWEHPSLVAA